jgi:hypothetical protein
MRTNLDLGAEVIRLDVFDCGSDGILYDDNVEAMISDADRVSVNIPINVSVRNSNCLSQTCRIHGEL